jgi:hypothetical protein
MYPFQMEVREVPLNYFQENNSGHWWHDLVSFGGTLVGIAGFPVLIGFKRSLAEVHDVSCQYGVTVCY